MDKFQTPAHDVVVATNGTRPHAKPRYQLIADELRGAIADGTLQRGDRLASEHELMRRFGVSRGTIRQALAALRADGVVSGSQGRRRSVNRPPLTQPLSELISFSAWAESLGRRPSARLIEARPAEADDDTGRALGLTPGDAVFRVVRVRLADDVPLMIERTAFVPAVGALLAGVNLETSSIYASLDAAGVAVGSARHALSAIPAARDDAKLLGIAADAPLLRVRRVGYAAGGEPLEWSDDRYRGDQVEFAIENVAMVSGVVRRMDVEGGR